MDASLALSSLACPNSLNISFPHKLVGAASASGEDEDTDLLSSSAADAAAVSGCAALLAAPSPPLDAPSAVLLESDFDEADGCDDSAADGLTGPLRLVRC